MINKINDNVGVAYLIGKYSFADHYKQNQVHICRLVSAALNIFCNRSISNKHSFLHHCSKKETNNYCSFSTTLVVASSKESYKREMWRAIIVMHNARTRTSRIIEPNYLHAMFKRCTENIHSLSCILTFLFSM